MRLEKKAILLHQVYV